MKTRGNENREHGKISNCNKNKGLKSKVLPYYHWVQAPVKPSFSPQFSLSLTAHIPFSPNGEKTKLKLIILPNNQKETKVEK